MTQTSNEISQAPERLNDFNLTNQWGTKVVIKLKKPIFKRGEKLFIQAAGDEKSFSLFNNVKASLKDEISETTLLKTKYELSSLKKLDDSKYLISDDEGDTGRSTEMRLNFNTDKFKIGIKEMYNEYLKLNANLNLLSTELENSKVLASLTMAKSLQKELKLYLKKARIINTRDINFKYKEKSVQEDIELLEIEISFLKEILSTKGINESKLEFEMPNTAKIKSLLYNNSLSFKLLEIEKEIINFEQRPKSGMQFVSLTSNMEQERGFKFGYTFHFGESARDSFKKIQNLRGINKSLRENRIKFVELKYAFNKAIKKYENTEGTLKSSKSRINKLKDKSALLTEIYNQISLIKRLYDYKVEMLNLFNEFVLFWGEEI